MTKSIFASERLTVRNLRHTDLEPYYKMVSNPKVMQYIKTPLDYKESEAELAKFIGYYDSSIFYNIWAVTKKDDNLFIGLCGIYLNQNGEYELAYRLLEEYWGNGYGSEIAQNLITFCFQKLNLSEIVAYAYSENIGSIKILEKYMDFVKEEVTIQTGVIGKKFSKFTYS